MSASVQLATFVKTHPDAVGRLVDFNPMTDKLYQFDLTIGNKELDAVTIADHAKFGKWVNGKLEATGAKYGIGGYMENRNIYAHSPLFNNGDVKRRHHLGVDIWGKAGMPIYSPLKGKVHSFKDNNNLGDYGPTIILEHNLDGLILHSLYGHLSRASLENLKVGQKVIAGERIATLGDDNENGHWPPHLHFQLIFDMEGKSGDYPGVCSLEEKEKYRKNIPNPQLILQFPKAVNA
ncbi:peptidoglycan DD-metalloendopeptidase family protein [Mucilaginibacter gotjawali]|uniref:Murein DD-endopeptidase MepM/ murein hydrolase activator NlpD n=1 Tax=Mucilaginibacter gotjawali TaxID=1550579 RepID=A0A839SI80_9SPHI|nr:peptidoglycan DD-metalloendopeptidase family protein [Mucilaginibacter gotjawali]MBB3057003.1 murein DD-endopeptidase MepM/ murein hydrolase activator NlpD [Mucilaginibacter gotjawali]